MKYKGKFTISKCYRDGSREIVEEAKNVIVDGFGYNLSRLFLADPHTLLDNFQVKYFQVGTSSVTHFGSPHFFALASALSFSSYGVDTNLALFRKKQIVTPNPFDLDNELILTTSSNVPFARVEEERVTVLNDDILSIQIILDPDTANNLELTEIGLFANNPDLQSDETVVMIAYKSFDPIPKTSQFSLVFNWQLLGVDCSECLLIPSYTDVYYGPSSVPVAERKSKHYLDVYLPQNLLPGGNAAVVWMHPGAYATGDKTEFNNVWAEKLLQRDIVFVPFNYLLAGSSGDGNESALTIPNRFGVFTSSQDTSAPLLPSSLNPFKYPNNFQNPNSDAVRALQFIKKNASTYNINKNLIVLAGNATGGNIVGWLAYAPEFSALPGSTTDDVEYESTRVRALMLEDAITDFEAFYPYTLGSFSRLPPIPAPKQLYMSGSTYVGAAAGGLTTLQSSANANYIAGVFKTSSMDPIRALPTLSSLLFGINGLFSPSLKNLLGLGAAPGGSGTGDATDWANIPALKSIHEHREMPVVTKRWYSATFHASATSSVLNPSYPTLYWGHPDNSAVWTHYAVQGTGLSSLGLSGIPSWRIILEPASVFALSSFFGGAPDNGIDTYEVSTLINRFGGSIGYIAEPMVNLSLSTTTGHVQSSSVGNASTLYNKILIPAPHDPYFGSLLINILNNTGPSHSASSLFDHQFQTLHSNVVNEDYLKTSAQEYSIQDGKVNWLVRMLSNYEPHYTQFIE